MPVAPLQLASWSRNTAVDPRRAGQRASSERVRESHGVRVTRESASHCCAPALHDGGPCCGRPRLPRRVRVASWPADNGGAPSLQLAACTGVPSFLCPPTTTTTAVTPRLLTAALATSHSPPRPSPQTACAPHARLPRRAVRNPTACVAADPPPSPASTPLDADGHPPPPPLPPPGGRPRALHDLSVPTGSTGRGLGGGVGTQSSPSSCSQGHPRPHPSSKGLLPPRRTTGVALTVNPGD